MKSTRIFESPANAPWLIFTPDKEQLSGFFKQGGVSFHTYHASGRAALFEGLKPLECSQNDNVLIPSYICDTATIPFRKMGIQIRFYDILPSLEPDIIDVCRKIDENTKAVMIVNYFGFPQSLTSVKGICQKHGLYLIEDNSHAILSKNNSRLLGTFGDIGFTSIYKELPTPNGGILFINNEKLVPQAHNSFRVPGYSLISDGFFLLSSTLRFLEAKYGLPMWILRKIYRRMYPSDENIGDKSIALNANISRITHEVMEKVDPADIIRRRRSNYEFWLNNLPSGKKIKILFEKLPIGVCPWVFPLVVDDTEYVNKIRTQGIDCDPWPPLPPEVQGKNDYANYLSEHLFILPVHQYVNQKYIK